MNKNKMKIDFWGDGMRIFIDYVQRQTKKNHDYKPHPLIRAFELAVYKIQDVKPGEHVMGVSQDGTKDIVYNPFIVVLEKKTDDSIEVKEIKNLQVDKELPLDVMIIIFRLQIQLDRIKGETINPDQMVESLNNVIPGKHFYALGDRWKEAREDFRNSLEEGKIKVPRSPEMEKVLNELKEITYDTPWEEYSPGARSLIGSHIKNKISEGAVSVIVTTPKSFPIEKYKVFDMATEFILGKSAEYIKIFKRPGGETKAEK